MGVVLFGTVRARGDVVDSVDVGEAGPRFAAAVSTAAGGFVRMWKRLEKFPATERRPAFELLSEAREVVVADCASTMSVCRAAVIIKRFAYPAK